MQYELLIDPRDIKRPHSMVLIGLHSPIAGTGVAAELRGAIADTAWLHRTDSQFLFGTGRTGTWLLAYVPTGAVSDLLLSAELCGVPLTLERLVLAVAAIEWEVTRLRRSGGPEDRMSQAWADADVYKILSPDAVVELVGDWCGLITQLPVNQLGTQTVVSRFPIPEALLAEWAELTTFSTARGQSPELCGA